jgi:hypothetical protein
LGTKNVKVDNIMVGIQRRAVKDKDYEERRLGSREEKNE